MIDDETIVVYGLGLIGRQRLDSCIAFGFKSQNIIAYDPNLASLDWREQQGYQGVIFMDDLTLVSALKTDRAIVAVPHDVAGPIVHALLEQDTKVLLEKPLGRTFAEAKLLAMHKHSHNLSIGFNYRFMPGIAKLKTVMQNAELGTISSLRLELGHGGAPKDLNSWKLDPVRAGGGVILDPGIHLIDLLIYLLSAKELTFELVGKTEWRGFWKTGIEESANLIGYICAIPFNITTSIVAWRTRFSLEVIGTEGYFEVEGRGRSDGPQKITQGIKWGWLSAASQRDSEIVSEVSKSDRSLIDETFAWLSGSRDVCTVNQALEGMKMYEKIMKFKNGN